MDVIESASCSMGYPELCDLQRRTIASFVSGKDVFVCIPTGGGKLLCYSVLPRVFNLLREKECSMVIVVSPLVALMKGQVASLKARGVCSVYLKGTTVGENADDFSTVCDGKYEVIFMGPESLLRDWKVRDMLLSPVFQENLVAVAIDEAHCVKKWLVLRVLIFLLNHCGMWSLLSYYSGDNFRKEWP